MDLQKKVKAVSNLELPQQELSNNTIIKNRNENNVNGTGCSKLTEMMRCLQDSTSWTKMKKKVQCWDRSNSRAPLIQKVPDSKRYNQLSFPPSVALKLIQKMFKGCCCHQFRMNERLKLSLSGSTLEVQAPLKLKENLLEFSITIQADVHNKYELKIWVEHDQLSPPI